MKEAADEMLDYQGSGMSVMEMSHRSKVYDNIIKEAEQDLRDLLNIPDNYKVLFLQGGASQFFAEVPMNLMKNRKAGYILLVSGQRKHSRKQKSTERQLNLLLLQMRHSLISRIVRIFQSQMIWIMYTSVKTIQFMEQNTKNFQTQRAGF